MRVYVHEVHGEYWVHQGSNNNAPLLAIFTTPEAAAKFVYVLTYGV